MSTPEKDKEDCKAKANPTTTGTDAYPHKVGRIGKPKVRTGCITCKVRRIKCDEGKPSCNRCTSTGRKCDGYVPQKKPHRDDHVYTPSKSVASSAPATYKGGVSIVAHNPLLDYHGTLQELRSFEYFLCHSAPTLAGWFDESFWRIQLPQAGHDQATIRHAMIAVASVHEQMEAVNAAMVGHWKPDTAELVAKRRFALQQYNASIYSLRLLLAQNPESIEITLSCCILFICIELLRGDFAAATIHLHSGLQILTKWRQDWPPTTTIAPLSLVDNLVRMFERLSLQSSLTAKPISHLHPTIPSREEEDPSHSVTFSSLTAARFSLDYLIKGSLQIILAGQELSIAPPDSPRRSSLEADRQEYCTKVVEWGTKFEAFYSATKNSMTTQERQGAEDMRIRQLVSFIWLDTCLIPDETAFDAHMDKFESIMAIAEALHAERMVPELSRSLYFSFEMGFLPPVYFVAVKCRHRILRRRAIALLKEEKPRREGMWNSGLLASAAEEIVKLEEEGMPPLDVDTDLSLDKYLGDSYLKLPHEDKRIHDTSNMLNKDEWAPHEHGEFDGNWSANRVGMLEIELRPREQNICFISRPGGVQGKWKLRNALVRW